MAAGRSGRTTTVEFAIDQELSALRERVDRFVRTVVLPAEAHMLDDPHEIRDDDRRQLIDAARAAGLLGPGVGREWGGLGLDLRGQAQILEAAGYSLLGPHALNCAAPDEGNMHLLERVGNPNQKDRYLRPLADGVIRSCFAMTEPPPGAGSDPTMLTTVARRSGRRWVISGRKWFITGAVGATVVICMARTSDAGATMFLVDSDNPGFRIVRRIASLDGGFVGGHSEVSFEDCEVGEDAVLGEVDRGFVHAQLRLAPARLTHCMRWLGVASRSQDLAVDTARNRSAFGSRLAELGMVQQMLADNEIDLAASRALVLRAAWVIDQGGHGSQESSIAKVFVSEAVNRIVDRAVQIAGSRGVSGELPLARFLSEVRAFRIYDGPTETHRWSIARRAVRDRDGYSP